MFSTFKDILKQLQSASDVAVIDGAGLLGFIADGAINIVPIPIFSPGVCGLTAMGGALVAKRGWEARQEAARNSAKQTRDDEQQNTTLNLAVTEATRLAERSSEAGRAIEADAPRFEIQLALARKDPAELLQRIRSVTKPDPA